MNEWMHTCLLSQLSLNIADRPNVTGSKAADIARGVTIPLPDVPAGDVTDIDEPVDDVGVDGGNVIVDAVPDGRGVELGVDDDDDDGDDGKNDCDVVDDGLIGGAAYIALPRSPLLPLPLPLKLKLAPPLLLGDGGGGGDNDTADPCRGGGGGGGGRLLAVDGRGDDGRGGKGG
jgi:hypothetical protein